MSQMKAIVDQMLTGVSSGYQPKGFICEQLLPPVPVDRSTGKLAKYGKSHMRVETSFIGGRGKARQVEAIVRSQAGYELENHALETMVTEQDYENVQDPYNAEQDEIMGVTNILWTEKEKVLADALSSTSVMTQNTTLSGGSQFSDRDNSDPIGVSLTASNAILDGCGMLMDTMWCDIKVANALRFHPQLLSSLGFKEARPGGLNDQELARAFGVQKILISNVRYNSAAEGQADVLASVWGKHLWFGVVPDSATVWQTSLGYRLFKRGSTARQVTRWALNNPDGANAFLVKDRYQFLLSDVTAGYLVKDAIA